MTAHDRPDPTALPAGTPSQAHIIEFDLEHGHVQNFGQAGVAVYRSGRGELQVESGVTGGCYADPQIIADVQLWNAEEHYLAVFPDSTSMRSGGRQLAAAWGDSLPVAIHRVLAAS
ncbi:MAG TPA: hypothetical protein VGM53_35250 [Streptosporangiaceae bacterium]